jgi:hypothetical protein
MLQIVYNVLNNTIQIELNWVKIVQTFTEILSSQNCRERRDRESQPFRKRTLLNRMEGKAHITKNLSSLVLVVMLNPFTRPLLRSYRPEIEENVKTLQPVHTVRNEFFFIGNNYRFIRFFPNVRWAIQFKWVFPLHKTRFFSERQVGAGLTQWS